MSTARSSSLQFAWMWSQPAAGRLSTSPLVCLLFVFFFQAEDGIRDLTVTGVQTCALPICDFGDPVFKPYTIRELAGVPVGIIGQAFPYTPIAHPRRFVAEWKFGIEEERLQRLASEIRGKGAQVVVLLSHNGVDLDLKLASRVTGIDVLLGGPSHHRHPGPGAGAHAE